MTADVENLPPPIRRPPSLHVFGAEVTIAADLSPSGFDQKEKTCRNCGSVRVTVFAPAAARAWRRNADGPQIDTTIAPPCDSEAQWP